VTRQGAACNAASVRFGFPPDNKEDRRTCLYWTKRGHDTQSVSNNSSVGEFVWPGAPGRGLRRAAKNLTKFSGTDIARWPSVPQPFNRISRLDYCNSVSAALPSSTLHALQRVQNTTAARLVFELLPRDHVSTRLYTVVAYTLANLLKTLYFNTRTPHWTLPPFTHITSSSFDSPLCSSITPSLLKPTCFTNSTPS